MGPAAPAAPLAEVVPPTNVVIMTVLWPAPLPTTVVSTTIEVVAGGGGATVVVEAAVVDDVSGDEVEMTELVDEITEVVEVEVTVAIEVVDETGVLLDTMEEALALDDAAPKPQYEGAEAFASPPAAERH